MIETATKIKAKKAGSKQSNPVAEWIAILPTDPYFCIIPSSIPRQANFLFAKFVVFLFNHFPFFTAANRVVIPMVMFYVLSGGISLWPMSVPIKNIPL